MNNKFEFNKANDEFKYSLNAFEHVITLDDVKLFSDTLELQRKALNAKLDDKSLNLAKILNVKDGLNLEFAIKSLQNTKEFRDKQYLLKDFDMEIFINAFENRVSYE